MLSYEPFTWRSQSRSSRSPDMKNRLVVACVQANPTVGDIAGNEAVSLVPLAELFEPWHAAGKALIEKRLDEQR